MLLSRLRLLQLGWFSRVETRVERGSERGLVVLVFDVDGAEHARHHRPRRSARPNPQPLYGGLGLSQQNFLGRGSGSRGAFVYGGAPSGRPEDPARFAVRASFFAPDVAVRASGGSWPAASALWLRGEELACADASCDALRAATSAAAPRLRYERVGGEVDRRACRPGPFERIYAGCAVRAARREPLPGRRPGPASPGRPSSSATRPSPPSSGPGSYDTRDDLFLPREGLRALAQVTFGSRLLGGRLRVQPLPARRSRPRFSLRARRSGSSPRSAPCRANAALLRAVLRGGLSYFAVGPALARALELNFSTDSRYDAFARHGRARVRRPALDASPASSAAATSPSAPAASYSTATLGGSRTPFSHTPLSGDVALRLDTPVGIFNVSVAYALDIAPVSLRRTAIRARGRRRARRPRGPRAGRPRAGRAPAAAGGARRPARRDGGPRRRLPRRRCERRLGNGLTQRGRGLRGGRPGEGRRARPRLRPRRRDPASTSGRRPTRWS